MVNKSIYKTLGEWKKAKRSDYDRARHNCWLETICNEMGWVYKTNKPMGYWTKDNVLKDAKKYNKKVIWMKTSPSSYAKALNRGWMEEASQHMIKNKPRGYWNLKENVINEAKKHFNIKEWSESSKVSYNKALNRGWLDEATQHMEYYGRNHLDK